jgi:hypothetical protein
VARAHGQDRRILDWEPWCTRRGDTATAAPLLIESDSYYALYPYWVETPPIFELGRGCRTSTQAEKSVAREQVRKARAISGQVGLAVRVLLVYSAGGGSEGQPAHPLNVLIACLYLVEKMFDNWAADAQAVVDDPPREDFDKPPRSRLRPFYAFAFGATSLEQSAVASANSLNQAAAEMRAMIAAREKAWGARLADRLDLEAQRRADASKLAAITAAELREGVPNIERFSDEVESSE